MKTAVVYVHGLWMTGLEGGLLRYRLAKYLNAYAPRFAYPSMRLDISANAHLLGRRLQEIEADTLHLVGHSLGGLVIYNMFQEFDANSLPPGRVVLLGSPLGGSRAARNLARWNFGKAIMGRVVREELLTPTTRQWMVSKELGVIAGTVNVGLGRIVNSQTGPSDGTIYVDETRIEGMKQHLLMQVSHTGMTFSKPVAKQVAKFLQSGEFAA
jgi:pimeloyl-ACP methyl ester carboxylesterase